MSQLSQIKKEIFRQLDNGLNYSYCESQVNGVKALVESINNNILQRRKVLCNEIIKSFKKFGIEVNLPEEKEEHMMVNYCREFFQLVKSFLNEDKT